MRLGGLDREVGYLLRRAQLVVFNDLIDNLKPFRLRPQQYTVLVVIAANPGINQETLGDCLGMQPPNLSALVAELHRRKFIRRERLKDDHRAHALHLTAYGKDSMKKIQVAHSSHETRISGILTTAERQRLLKSLRKLAELDSSVLG